MASLAGVIEGFAAPWHDLYASSEVLPIAVTYLHLLALLIGGGLALSADLNTWRVSDSDGEGRTSHLRALASTHGLIVGALGVSAATGVLLFLADVHELAQSRILWTKMLLLVLLTVNALVMTRRERALRQGDSTVAVMPLRWRQMRASASVSAVLWCALLLCGTVLGNS